MKPSAFAFSTLWTTVPGNSGFVIPWDSTRGLAYNLQNTAIAAGSAYLIPGPMRGKFVKAVVTWTCETTGQDVTVSEQELGGAANAAADWVTVASYNIVAAAAAIGNEFTPATADHRLLVTAGATGPTTIIFRTMVHFTSDRGA